jgi:NADH:ubiquinone oxidoreductase subunit 6 (subunit J)
LAYHCKQYKYKNKSVNKVEQSNPEIIGKEPKIIYSEYDLNNSSYIKALLYDKRMFCQYYYSLLKFEHLLFFAIIPSKDYNSKVIKICIFLFTFALFFTNNAIFMNEDAIHNIYENHGTYDLIYQIPQIIYSNIISFIIDKIIRFLSLSRDYLINPKLQPKITNKIKSLKKVFRVLFVKYIFFFIFSFLLLFLFWLYIACFCFVYRNTQIYLIKDTIFSFGLSLLSPFIFYLLSAIFRIYSLKNRSRKILYILSQWFLF